MRRGKFQRLHSQRGHHESVTHGRHKRSHIRFRPTRHNAHIVVFFLQLQPSYYHIDACCDSVILQLPKQIFDNFVKESHEFAQWALSMAQCQLYYDELKQSLINGNAKERYLSLLNNRPEILQKVSLGIVASYLGVTQQYLSYIRKQLTK